MIKHQCRNPIRIVYIAGHGRSGSTILDNLLGNHMSVTGLGELKNITKGNWIQDKFCSCGQKIAVCSFWQSVLQQWYARTGMDSIVSYQQLEHHFIRYRHIPSVLLKQIRQSDPLFVRYAEQTLALFQSICDVSGKQVLVDSSKSPVRAFMLAQMDGLDLRLIHLVRDGRGVAWSLKKPFVQDAKVGWDFEVQPRSIYYAAWSWTIVNLAVNNLRQYMGHEQTMVVRYEDLMSNLNQTLSDIGNFIKCDYAQTIQGIISGKPLQVEHVVGGNRVRMQKNIRLKIDEAWRENLPPHEKLMFFIIAGAFLRYYGYV